ncbi:ATP-binding protein [Methanobrevibacter acididurans]|uniref:ATP-binding protein n=1 Tax=Methanobrevibacter acididurans TaxID=120963 RepID=UPI0038FBF799
MKEKFELNKNDIFALGKEEMVGKPFYLDYSKACILIGDESKAKVHGIPKGTFLLAYYDNDNGENPEAILLRAMGQVHLPNQEEIFSTLIEYYKEPNTSEKEKMDPLTRYAFSFSGLECNVLGSFHKTENGDVYFGSDIDNFYSPSNYTIYKPKDKALEAIVNLGVCEKSEKRHPVSIGKVKYSSSCGFKHNKVNVYVSSEDFIGKRTAIFGMTRTGKSNTLKKIIQLTDKLNTPKNPIGQIVFDINGEYANSNQQDEGTAIYEILNPEKVVRYSVLDKPNFKTLRANFYHDINEGFNIIKTKLGQTSRSGYMEDFVSIELHPPKKPEGEISQEEKDLYFSKMRRYKRKEAAYQCCLYKAGFELPKDKYGNPEKIRFTVSSHISNDPHVGIDPTEGISYEDAIEFFTSIWQHHDEIPYLRDYPLKHENRTWIDKDLENLLIMLTRCKKNSTNENLRGYKNLEVLNNHHTTTTDNYKKEIINFLREGKIIIVDLSQGEREIQNDYSKRICEHIFKNSIKNFIKNKENNTIQFYFEEAHNLFPKHDDSDLNQIYNRIAKEGAKLNLGLVYATQEVSSISSNILKNTQNWFISHLNNTDELNELRKFYDFEDFLDTLRRFAPQDKGFVRMKTYSNPFVVPVQIDKFGG